MYEDGRPRATVNFRTQFLGLKNIWRNSPTNTVSAEVNNKEFVVTALKLLHHVPLNEINYYTVRLIYVSTLSSTWETPYRQWPTWTWKWNRKTVPFRRRNGNVENMLICCRRIWIAPYWWQLSIFNSVSSRNFWAWKLNKIDPVREPNSKFVTLWRWG
jgi:hypothetical protein